MPFAMEAAAVSTGLPVLGLPGLGVPLPGLLAAGLIDAIGPLLVVAFWVIRQVLVSLKEQRELDRARKAAEERGEPWPPAAEEAPEVVLVEANPAEPATTAAPKAGQADLRSEVEEFLRRAANPAAQPAPRPAEKRPLDPFDDRPTRKRQPPRPVRSEQASSARPPSKPEPIVEPAPSPRVSLRHLPDSQLAENAAHLGETIAASDNRVEARLHDKFDHRLGNLSGRPAVAEAAATEPVSAAARIRRMLSKPGGAREAVILSEILRRPTDRI